MNPFSPIKAVGLRGILKSIWYSHRCTSSIDSLLLHSNVIVNVSPGAEFDINNRLNFGVHDRGATHPRLRKSKFSVGPSGQVRHTGENGARIGAGSVLHVEGDFDMGDSYINSDARIICGDRITIGDGVAISWDVTLLDDDRHQIAIGEVPKQRKAPIDIEDNVLIGHRVTIQKGVTIGKGAIIASNSVVTSDVPKRSLAAGTPAEVIKVGVSWDSQK